MSDPKNNEVIDISSTNEVTVSYTNTSENRVEVWWSFISKDSPSADMKIVMANSAGDWFLDYVNPGEKIDKTFQLNTGTRTSWDLSESVCEDDKDGIYSGGRCIWDDGFDPTKLFSVEISIVGAGFSGSSGWENARLDGETVVFHSISGGSADCESDTDDDVDDSDDEDIDDDGKDDIGDTCVFQDTIFTTIFDTTHVILFDTNYITVKDTVLVAVHDTLIIDIDLSYSAFKSNIMKVYPNPANDVIIVDNGNFTYISDYTLKIVNTLGTEVFNRFVSIPQFQIPTSILGDGGLYYIQIFDDDNNLITTKKLILN